MIRPPIARTFKVDLPGSGFDNYFAISDIHSEHYCPVSHRVFLQHVDMVPRVNRKLIINGDMLDCLHFMGKPGDFRKMAASIPIIENVLIPDSELEFQWGNDYLDMLQNYFDEIYYIQGNHDWRYKNFALNYSPTAYKHHFDISLQLNLKKRGIQMIEYPDYLDVGNLTVTHGVRHGNNHNKAMYELVGRSILYGHVHHYNCTSFVKRGVECKAFSMPCMSLLSPEYQIKRGENNWSNGYANFQVKPNGKFNMFMAEIYDGELILPCGTMLKGNNEI